MQSENPRAGAKEYETSYLRDVLGFEEGLREEEIDDRLVAEARELGIDVQTKQSSGDSNKRPASMPVLSSDTAPRRSSVDSRTSTATSTVSTSSSLPRHANGMSASRASLSFRDYDNFMARGRPEGRASMSFSLSKTPSASTSVFSLPLSSPESSPKKHYRLMRGLNMLKLNRADSATAMRGCPHCPRDPISQRRAVHKLPCGHRLCTQALRDTIKAGTAGGTGAIPSCCGIPMPGWLVEHVMTQQEQSVVLDSLDKWSQAGSATPSMKSEARGSATSQRPGALSTASRTASDESKVDSIGPGITQKASIEDMRPEVGELRKEQTELQDRFIAWIETRRAQLAEKHEHWRKEMRARHEAAAESLEEHHAQSMSEAEDKQVKAESDMRILHAQEERDTATALKHMEAYCAGTYVSTGESHGRPVAEQDLAELENARRTKDGMAGRHDSAINVLRGEQARRLRLRGQRQEKEMVETRRAQRREELDGERERTNERREMDDFVEGRWGVLRRRWEVEGRLLSKRAEMESNKAVSDEVSGGGHLQDVTKEPDAQATHGVECDEGIR